MNKNEHFQENGAKAPRLVSEFVGKATWMLRVKERKEDPSQLGKAAWEENPLL